MKKEISKNDINEMNVIIFNKLKNQLESDLRVAQLNSVARLALAFQKAIASDLIDEKQKEKTVKEFKSKKGKPKINIQRFKGLGEMNPSQLRETVMDPDTRQLVRLSISATDNANAMMDLLLSKKNAPARKEWLEKKGSLVRI